MKFSFVLLTALTAAAAFAGVDPDQKLERTSFQVAGSYKDGIDLKSDVAMVYGIGGCAGRIKMWRDEGYIVHLMTGVAWGNYQDYLDGKWDGKDHWDAAQKKQDGTINFHGDPAGRIPYMCPDENYGKYLCVGVQQALDAGAEAIHLEEPEFFSFCGYSDAFKREWEAYYKEPWIAPHESVDARYRTSKLMYYLYRRALTTVFDFVKKYNEEHGTDVKCYVPTHSMINYTMWGIVSPEASLVQIEGCDGYIGQVWTGTARTPNRYAGVKAQRTFETAYLEYGILNNLVRSTGRRMWYLNDPVEDSPDYCWADYKENWESTLVASLLWPNVFRYEVVPWPDRVFIKDRKYPTKNKKDLAPGEQVGYESIPAGYATELITVFNALNDQKQDKIFRNCGLTEAGILLSDTMMFRRGEPFTNDPNLDSMFGIALPLIKNGTMLEPVQMENMNIDGYLDPYKILFVTYEGMNAPGPESHTYIADWVKKGGVLVIIDDGKDPYNSVKEWWNTGDYHYDTPMQHLLETLGVTKVGASACGEGFVIYSDTSAKGLARSADGAYFMQKLAQQACELTRTKKWHTVSHMVLRKGKYVVGAGLSESNTDNKTFEMRGKFVNLFDPELAVVKSLTFTPDARIFAVDLSRESSAPAVVASASKITAVKRGFRSLTFDSEGPSDVNCATRVLLPAKPEYVTVDGKSCLVKWDADSSTALLMYSNTAKERNVVIKW